MPLADADCLTLIDRGRNRHPLDRALLLAAAGEPDVVWADRPLGLRDARLLALRCEWIGPVFDAVVACPQCHELLSLHADLRTFMARAPEDGTVNVAGRHFRRPTTRDLAALVGEADVSAAARALLRGLWVDDDTSDWTRDHQEEIDKALEEADPLAHVSVEATCERCGRSFMTPLDIAALLWADVEAQARRIVDDVHALARAYGWSESAILEMPPARRELYLARVGA